MTTTMAVDGGLNQLIQKHLPWVHWCRIETGGTGRGIPDLNGCWHGVEVWLELKRADHWQVKIQPEQVAWIERRARSGGRVFIAVRQKQQSLWLLPAAAARLLVMGQRLDRLRDERVIYRGEGGPARWNWGAVEQALFSWPLMSQEGRDGG